MQKQFKIAQRADFLLVQRIIGFFFFLLLHIIHSNYAKWRTDLTAGNHNVTLAKKVGHQGRSDAAWRVWGQMHANTHQSTAVCQY